MKQLLLLLILMPFQITFAALVTPPPTANAQNFCDYVTVGQLVANGTEIKWYENQNGGTALNSNIQVFTGTYYASQTLNEEESVRIPVDIIVNAAPLVDELGVVYGCHSYTLQPLTVGNYFGDSAHTEAFNVGDVFDISRNLYVFAENECGGAQSEFYIIIETELDFPAEDYVETCNSYFLPDFYEGGYYTQPGGNGSVYAGGDEVTYSQTLYKYATNSCGSAQTTLYITINAPAWVEFRDDVYMCGSYTLPPISSGHYYSASNTGGELLQPGTVLTTSQVIYMYAGNGCGDAESSFYVNISDIDTALAVDNGVLVAQQQGAVYQWWDCNDNSAPIEGEAGQTFTPLESGDYSVFITLGDCQSWSDCVFAEALSVPENQPAKISFGPNPVSSFLHIDNPGQVIIDKVLIADMSGKIILREDGGATSYNLEHLASGMYLLQLISNNGSITHKFLKY